MKRVAVLLCFLGGFAFGQIPQDYYTPAYGKKGPFLVNALHNIIKNHIVVSAASLSTAIQKIDLKPNGKAWDLYGYVSNGAQNYEYTFGTAVCGIPLMESDCYDLEYVWPKAWFNNEPVPSTDLHNIFVADGYVRSKRGILPFGTAITATYTSLNWSKIGMCGDNGYTGMVFEPTNDVKGDIARAFFYMAIRYLYEDQQWGSSAATAQSGILPWQLSVLLSWNHTDPVSAKEKARNDSIYYMFQNNRNPFIDHPQFADSIWTYYIGLSEFADGQENYNVFPNPTNNGKTQIAGLRNGDVVEVTNTLGLLVSEVKNESELVDIDLSSKPKGVYVVTIKNRFRSYTYKVINSP